MKKAIPVIIAILLIAVIGAGYVGKIVLDKYSYSDERVDLDEFYGISSSDELAIIVQDEMMEEKATVKNGYCYLDIDTVHKYLSEIFYEDKAENLLLYTSATDTKSTSIGTNLYRDDAGEHEMDYTISLYEGDILYISLDYVKKFTPLDYTVSERKLQLYTQWGSKPCASVTKDTFVRKLGGIKSPIMREIYAGETVDILETMETWTKVKTSDSIIGYIENKRLGDTVEVVTEKPTDYEASEYTSISLDKKICLAWHAIGGVGGNDTLGSMVSEGKGMNVIAPTWFSLNDNEGGYRDFASADYVSSAHAMGLQVWGVIDDFNYDQENQNVDISALSVLSSTTFRQKLVNSICDRAVSLGLDGINIDFETIGDESGPHYVQFLRELSVLCRKNGLILSIDNPVPFYFNECYRMDIQGEIADYVIMMGYDERGKGSKETGSVASIGYVSNGLDTLLSKVPAQKVVNALPFYTLLWKTDGTEVSAEYITLNNMKDFLNRVNAKTQWDETTCQKYAEWNSGSALYQIWVEDEESISVKLNVMTSKDIGGVAVWRLGYGTDAVWQLVSAYAGS